MMKWQWGILFLFVFLLVACGESADVGAQRNTDGTQLALGKKVYSDNCANCHGANAEGAANGSNVADMASNLKPELRELMKGGE